MASVLTWLAAMLISIGQVTPKGQLTIVVREAGTDQPVAGASVWLTCPNDRSAPREATTADDGQARIADLPAGQYEIAISHAGYLSWDVTVDNSDMALPPFHRTLKSGSVVYQPGRAAVRIAGQAETVTFRLPRGGIIAGTVLDEEGRPMRGAWVKLLKTGDSRVDRHAVLSSVHDKITVADGAFEFIGLAAGAYRIAANPEADAGQFNDIYYPGTTEIEASEAIAVDVGGRRDVTVRVRRVPTVTVKGRVIGHNPRDGELTIRRLDVATGDVISRLLVDVARDGTFEIDAVESAVHGLQYVRQEGGQQPTHAAFAVFHIDDRPLSDLELEVLPVASMSGRIVSQGDAPSTNKDLHVLAEPAGTDPQLRWMLSRSDTAQDGQSFRVDTLFGSWRFVVRAPSGWLATAMLLEDGTDILKKEFHPTPGVHYGNVRVILAEGVATIKGAVPMGGLENLYGGLMVVAFPTDEETWRFWDERVISRVLEDGTFTLTNVVPGRDYFVAACRWPCETRDGKNLKALAEKGAQLSIGRPGEYRVTLKR